MVNDFVTTGRQLPTTKTKYIHIMFTSRTELPEKVVIALQSALRTQKDASIILWTDHVDDFKAQLEPVIKTFVCPSRATLEVWPLERLMEKLTSSTDELVNAEKCQSLGQGNAVSDSDMFRFLVLFFYGGIYVDADTLFLKDLDVFHGLSFAFKWGCGGPDNPVAQGFNTAIMGLPKRSPITKQIIAKRGCSPSGFYPSQVHEALDCRGKDKECVGLAMMPTMLFDPGQEEPGTEELFEGASLYVHDLKRIFEKPSPFANDDNFFPGAFTYHWHNQWDTSYREDSHFARLKKLNSQCNATETL